MENLIQIARANPDYYAEMALKANLENKVLSAVGETLVLSDPPSPGWEQYERLLNRQVQAYLNESVQKKHYDDIASACSYVTSENPQFQAEAKACIRWRDALWLEYARLTDIIKNTGAPFPDMALVIAQLPPMQWPDEDEVR